MIVADTSVWIEYLRGTNHPTRPVLARLIDEGSELAVTEVVVAEVLAGARSPEVLRALRALMLSFPVLTLETLVDYEEAAALQRACRAAGETRSALTDFLVAVPAIRAGASLLHCDADFDVIARHSPLKIYRAR